MITLKTKNATFVDLINGLFGVQDLKGVRFSLAVSKNIRILQQELQDIEEAAKATDEFTVLSATVNAAKDNPEELKKLEEDNKDLIDARRAQLAEVDVLLQEEVEIALFPISVDVLPEQITALQITNIDKLIKE